MVIRVDVVEAALARALRRATRWTALRAAGDRARRRGPAASTTRSRASSPRSRAAHAAVRPLRGLRRAGPRAPRHRRRLDRAATCSPGGELAAMVVCDAVIRKLPGALGHAESAVEESFSSGARGSAGVPALHPPGELARARRAGGPALRRPRPDPRLAARAQPRARQPASASAEAHRTLRYHSRSRAPPPGTRALPAMSGVIDSLERAQLRESPRSSAGDRVQVHFQVIEGTRRRTQVFEGMVLKRQGSGARETFTVRKQSFGVGVERTFPAALAEDRADRGRQPRRRPARQALLPARPGRPPRARARAPGRRRAARRPSSPDVIAEPERRRRTRSALRRPRPRSPT